MPYKHTTFGPQQCLEASLNEKTQEGLLELDNVSVEFRNVIDKRPGSEQIALTTGPNDNDVLDQVGLQALDYRKDELCIWSDRNLYSRNIAVSAGTVQLPVGQATDEQISTAINNAAADNPNVRTFTLAGNANADVVAASVASNRPTSASVSGTDTSTSINFNYTATSTINGSGSLSQRIVISSSVPYANMDLTAILDSSGASDVRLVFSHAEVDTVGPAQALNVYFVVSWRDGGTLKWERVTAQMVSTGFKQILQSLLETFLSTNNMPYDMARTFHSGGEGTLPAIWITSSSSPNQVRVRYIRTNGTKFDEFINLPFSVTTSDHIVIPIDDNPNDVFTPQSLFFRFISNRWDLYLMEGDNSPFIALIATGIAGAMFPNSKPNARFYTGPDTYMIGFPQEIGGSTTPRWLVFALDAAGLRWVGARSGSSGSMTGVHTITATINNNNFTLQRSGSTVFQQTFGNNSSQKAILKINNILSILRIQGGSIFQSVYQPGETTLGGSTGMPVPTFTVLGAAVGGLATGQIANRITFSYRETSVGGQSRLRLYSSADGIAFVNASENDSRPWFTPSSQASITTGTIIDLTAVGGNQISGTYFNADSTSLTRRTTSNTDPLGTTILSIAITNGFQKIYAQDFVTFDLVALTYSNRVVVYEFGPNYAIQVSPRLITLAGGNFGLRGPWTSTKLRQEVPLTAQGGGQIVACDIGQVEESRIAIYQVSGGTVDGIYISVVTDHLELPGFQVRIDAAGTHPRATTNHRDGSVLLTWITGGIIQFLRWTPEITTLSQTASGISPLNNVYEVLAPSTAVGNPPNKYLIIARQAAPGWRFVRYNAATMAVLDNTVFNLGTPSADAFAATVESEGDDIFVVRTAFPGAAGISTQRTTHNDGGAGSITTTNANSFTIAPATVRRLAIVSRDGTSNYNLLIENTSNNTILAKNTTTEPASETRRWFRHSIWSNGVRLENNRTYAVLGGSGGLNDATGYWLIDLDSTGYGGNGSPNEIVGRSFVSEGEFAASVPGRLTTCHLDFPSITKAKDLDRLVCSAAVQLRGSDLSLTNSSLPGVSDLNTMGIATTTFVQDPFICAELDGVLIHAQGGYPRMYAGDRPHEHDFHTQATVLSLATPVGGSLSAGNYTVAVCYESTDPEGNVYRSGLSFLGPVAAAAGDRIDASVAPLAMTERRDVQIVMWRTIANGTVFFRDENVTNNPQASGNVTITGTVSDSILQTREILDTSRVVRNPIPSTDFVAVSTGPRFFTPDPERRSLVWYSTPRVEGFAPSWNRAQAVEAAVQRDVTAIGDLDGRVVLFTNFETSVVDGQGPDATGQNGSFSLAQLIPSLIGCTDQLTLSLIDRGIVFGSQSGPRILERSLDVRDLGDNVYRFFEDEGFRVIRTLYVHPYETLYFYCRNENNDPLVLKVSVTNGRWAKDTSRDIFTADLSRSGTIAYLTSDGRLLTEGDADLIRYNNLLAARTVLGFYPEYFFNGTLVDQVQGATLTAEGGAFLSEDIGTLGVFNRTSYEATGIDTQNFRCDDITIGDLAGTTPTDRSIAIIWSQTLDVSPPASRGIMGKQTNLAGPEQFVGWGIDGDALGPRLFVDPEPLSPTITQLTTASYTPTQRRWFCAVIDFVNQQLRLGSDIENATPLSIVEPLASYTTTAPMRVLDFRDNTNPPIDGKIHWWMILRGTQATSITDCRAMALQMKAADQTAEDVGSIAELPDRTDGEFTYTTRVRTNWFRMPSDDAKTHPRFVYNGTTITGKYRGSHDLFINVYRDFETVPYFSGKINRRTIDDNELMGKPYIYTLENLKMDCYAFSVEVFDSADPNPTFLMERMDHEWQGAPSGTQFNLGAEHKFIKI